MKAKDLFGDQPNAPEQPVRRVSLGPRRRDDESEDEVGQKGFNPREASMLKDVIILMLASLMQSQLDTEIGTALMKGEELRPDQLQHLIDETRMLDLPPQHAALLQRIESKLRS